MATTDDRGRESLASGWSIPGTCRRCGGEGPVHRVRSEARRRFGHLLPYRWLCGDCIVDVGNPVTPVRVYPPPDVVGPSQDFAWWRRRNKSSDVA